MTDKKNLEEIGQNNPNKTIRGHHPDEVKDAARKLYLRRYSVSEISKMLNVPERTLYSWASKAGWDDLLSHESTEEAYNRRISLLISRENKTASELKEMDLILNHLERLQKLKANEKVIALAVAQAGGQKKQGSTENLDALQKLAGFDKNNPFHGKTEAKKKKGSKTKKNDVSKLELKDFEERLHKRYFDYQKEFYIHREMRNRQILKSRQVGATWYLAQERFEEACLKGEDQIFLSATKAQSEIFRNYIIDIAGQNFDIKLTGNPICLNTAKGPAYLRFLATSSRSAQGYSGHVVMDEFFWIPKFQEFYKVATGMAAHRKWTRTLASSPSIITHEAYPLWSGDLYQRRFKNPKAWPDRKTLQKGRLCPDNTWRKILTLDDAVAGGCDLFDLDELKLEYSPDEYAQLFNCVFIDDAQAVFTLKLLENCMVDPDFWGINLKNSRPVKDSGVWCGYDPARTRDDASFVVLLPAQKTGEKIKVLERFTWKNKSYLWQVEQIKKITDKYRVLHMGIDVTGPGQGVYENVRLFCPVAKPITYSVMTKAQLVLKALEVMEQGRLEFDAAETDIAKAFMMIKQISTNSGQITYAANRTDKSGHADVAWAIMHALAAEPLARKRIVGSKTSSLAFSA